MKIFAKNCLYLGLLVFLSVAGVANAVPPGLYAGADLVDMDTDVTFSGVTGNYGTTHLRLKGGIAPLDFLAVEAQLLTSAHDNYDFAGNPTTLKTGNIVGVFAKPHFTAGAAKLYGLVGFVRTKATFSDELGGSSKTISDTAFGVGAEFGVAQNLKLSVDYINYFDKRVTFPDFLPSDLQSKALGVGVNYTWK